MHPYGQQQRDSHSMCLPGERDHKYNTRNRNRNCNCSVCRAAQEARKFRPGQLVRNAARALKKRARQAAGRDIKKAVAHWNCVTA